MISDSLMRTGSIHLSSLDLLSYCAAKLIFVPEIYSLFLTACLKGQVQGTPISAESPSLCARVSVCIQTNIYTQQVTLLPLHKAHNNTE